MTFAYQWQRCSFSAPCADIAGETARTYVERSADVGAYLRVIVTATNDAGTTSAHSDGTDVVTAVAPSNTVAPVVSGTAIDGQQLTGSHGTWTGTRVISYDRQWQRCDAYGQGCVDIDGATSAIYQLTPADVGSTIRMVEHASNLGGDAEAASAVTGVVAASPPSRTVPPKVTGDAIDGQVLTASTGQWSGSAPITYTYAWQRCDFSDICTDIDGATSDTYRLTSAEVGTNVQVVVTAHNAGGAVSATSVPTGMVQAVAPSSTAVPTISGDTMIDRVLTASVGAWSGSTPMTYTYQWQRCNIDLYCVDIDGATGPTHRLVWNDVQSRMRVIVTAHNAGGAEHAASDPSAEIAAYPPVNATAPSITGSAVAGQTLTASPGSWSGTPPITYMYQWQRCEPVDLVCADIDGATSAAYRLTSLDVGTKVRVVVIAHTIGGGDHAPSDPTATVAGS